MGKKKLKILLIFDLAESPPKDHDYTEYLSDPDWKWDRALVRALEKLGHEVMLLGIFNDIRPLMKLLESAKPDLVFNTCEAVHKDRDYEPNLVALLELLKVKFTGANSTALQLCKDKGLSKKLLRYHHIRVPEFLIAQQKSAASGLAGFHYPAIVKPIGGEASEGISRVSRVENEKDCLERIQFIHEKLKADAIVEEYIDGRELYVGVLGNDRLTTFPPRELHFRNVPEGEPTFATYKAKWDQAYRKKWGIRTESVRGIDAPTLEKASQICKKTYRALCMNGFGRIDLRVREDGEIVVLEANPNPSLGKEEDFALSAEKAGMSYEKLLERIISLSGV